MKAMMLEKHTTKNGIHFAFIFQKKHMGSSRFGNSCFRATRKPARQPWKPESGVTLHGMAQQGQVMYHISDSNFIFYMVLRYRVTQQLE
jgi:hypothetical protein